MDIPADKDYPVGAVQCGGCNGTGTGCGTCNRRGWLPAGHHSGRTCTREECSNLLVPACTTGYCSDACALSDAEGGRVVLSTHIDPELARQLDGHTDPKTRH